MTHASGKIRVLIVDDSALVRQLLGEMLAQDSGIEVVGSAADPYQAREKIKKLNPDVLTLDVEMPRMDGLTFLSNLMRLHPMPVLMVSTLTERGADTTLRALELGAVDFVSKPKTDLAHTLADYAEEIIAKVKMVSQARLRPPAAPSAPRPSVVAIAERAVDPKLSADAVLARAQPPRHFKTTDRIIAIGASTGGTEAIKEVLMRLPVETPGVVISQHIPEAFSGPFARRMDSLSAMTVFEAQDGQQILPGHVYIAPGNHHLLIVRDGARYVCKLSNGPPVNRHRPSVDVMFRSVAQNVGPNALGVILTGMGDDGARGLKEMHEAGAATIAQDEKTSVVWGMPGEAVKHGGVDQILPLDAVAPALLRLVQRLDAAPDVRIVSER
ncbi:MAG: chemotaxis response regulator protein-glutamate methylesterase [Gammaproteobacteria bacterium]|nr:MAG: chemotaxis response regulator protein-glutamate methylesterase [Gammaproteobacteria bacterium]